MLSLDGKKALSTTERLIDLYTTQAEMNKSVEKIQTLLQGSSLYDVLDDKPDRLTTLKRLASAQEQADDAFYEREVRQRRGRLGSGTQEQVQTAVKNELYSASQVNNVLHFFFPELLEMKGGEERQVTLLIRVVHIARVNVRIHLGTRAGH